MLKPSPARSEPPDRIRTVSDGNSTGALSPIPGRRIDPDVKPKPAAIASLEEKSPWATALWNAFRRFKGARIPLIAGGTAYYAFLALFSLLALGYGIAALIGSDWMADVLTKALEEALPGLVGEQGIKPADLASIGRSASILGLAVLVYSGSAVMVAMSHSLHQLYGAPPDPRNYAHKRVRLLGWLLIVGPLIVLSYTMSTAVVGYGDQILDDLGINASGSRFTLTFLALLITAALDAGIGALLLSRFGGVMPPWAPLVIGSIFLAVAMGILKAVMGTIIAWSVDKPQYGSFTAPISILVIFWLQANALYFAAAITAALAETRQLFDGAPEGSAASPE
jgi:uncharacterized BrkB/YihY/UPF0761 family membrane protein